MDRLPGLYEREWRRDPMTSERSKMIAAASRSERSSDSRLVVWFGSASRPGVAYGLLGVAAVGYSAVALLLSIAGALPMPTPYLRIPDADYFATGAYFYAPVIVAAWLLASSVMYVSAEVMRSKPEFDELLTPTAFATGLGTLGTLTPDLVTSFLRALRVIDERAWEASIAQHGAWFIFTWVTLTTYLLLFLIGYPLAVRQATGLAWPKAIATGVVGFLVFQGVEYVFIR
jgi:hypothetical protein